MRCVLEIGWLGVPISRCDLEIGWLGRKARFLWLDVLLYSVHVAVVLVGVGHACVTVTN